MTKPYKIGQLVIVIDAGSYYKSYVGKQGTILKYKTTSYRYTPDSFGYQVELQGGEKILVAHQDLKPVNPPKGEKFEEFMQNILKPVGLLEEDLV